MGNAMSERQEVFILNAIETWNTSVAKQLAQDGDTPWKDVLARMLPEAIALFMPSLHPDVDWSRGYSLLDKELQQVAPDAESGRRTVELQLWQQVQEVRGARVPYISSLERYAIERGLAKGRAEGRAAG